MAAGVRAAPPLLPHPGGRKARAAALRGAPRLGVAAAAAAVLVLALSYTLSEGGERARLAADQADGRLFVLAFYFPQFHPIPENDAIYFEGFSDWALVKDAPPTNRLGAPVKKPAPPLGYYDPRDYIVRRAQAQLARDYGLDGFIYYHYWLENKLVMGEVIDRMLLDGQPDLPFVLCWVNESWQRKFYGMERKVTFEQKFDAPADHAAYLARVFESPLYLRVDGRPLLIVYTRDMPQSYLSALQDGVEALTGRRMFITSCLMTLEDMYRLMPGADALVEFHPNLNPGYPNTTNYGQDLALAEQCPYPMTAEGFFNVTVPRLRAAMCEARSGDALYAVFAWNEWGEGAVLEPNTGEGARLGEALARARREAERLHGEDRASGRCRGAPGAAGGGGGAAGAPGAGGAASPPPLRIRPGHGDGVGDAPA
ncbi:hypothetical protein Rsub_06808 [Raphidocelis subcapitata]|uniref:Glycosyltransferase n=1 Tax=Raphidocelis subcapitata TaxID=307507 RepID=A0A2V0P9D5_9CHLO|nr:hypothetical protein Rsub_06808 [Raphidocelis subcapitata]|eukprot:GBF93705.1 hypothetical protein Rsub_06808 [Raphidocelis subcapitata]